MDLILESKRLLLRPLELNDAEAFLLWITILVCTNTFGKNQRKRSAKRLQQLSTFNSNTKKIKLVVLLLF